MALVVADNRQKQFNQRLVRGFGFTLLELMVTIAVLGIILTIAVPSFTSIVLNNRLAAQSNDILGAFYLARAESIKLNQTVRLCQSVDNLSCSAAPANGWQGWIVVAEVADPVVIASGILSSEQLRLLSSEVLSNQGDIIRLNAQGLVRTANNSGLNATLRVCALTDNVDDNSRDIEIRSGGRARVITTAAGSACDVPQD